MLDMKHKNIGATVSMISMIHTLTADEELPNEMTKLFALESDECDWKKDDAHCYYNRVPVPCMVGNCPLGNMVDKELKDSPGLPAIGPCAGCGKPVNMDNLAHVDDDMQICETCFAEKENMKS